MSSQICPPASVEPFSNAPPRREHWLECAPSNSAPATSGPEVLRYLRAATAENTRRAYQSDLRHFLRWGGTFPAVPGMIADYLAAHTATLSVATLIRRVAAISKAHRSLGLATPTSAEVVKMTLRGIRRTHGRPQRQVTAAIKEDVLAMVAKLGGRPKDDRDRALLLIGFAGAFRRSELVSINYTDIVRVPQGIVITVPRSKTDQDGEGRRIGIPFARGMACPVKALDAWLEVSGIIEGPVFRPVARHGKIADARLSPEAVALVVKERAARAGLDPTRYAGHSLRAGLATSAASAGVPAWKIRDQTGHASDAMLHRYIRDGQLFVNNAAGAVL